MGNAQWMLELALLLLLAATLFHAMRLERALGRTETGPRCAGGFGERLQREHPASRKRHRAAADSSRRCRTPDGTPDRDAQRLRDDLTFLADRSDKLAERLEGAVRSARMFADTSGLPQALQPASTSLPAPMTPAEPALRRASGTSVEAAPGTDESRDAALAQPGRTRPAACHCVGCHNDAAARRDVFAL